MGNLIEDLPNLPYTIRAIVILAAGVIMLRLVGKRSIAQLTIPESVFLIAIGTILIQPLGNKNEWGAIYGGLVLIAGMLLLSWLQIQWPWIRKFVYGVPATLISNGEMDLKKMKKVKMTTNQLEMRLRLLQVDDVKNVKTAVLEPSGQLSIALTEPSRPANKNDIQHVLNQLQSLQLQVMQLMQNPSMVQQPQNLILSKNDPLFTKANKEDQKENDLYTH